MSPIAFSIGPVTVRWYGLLIALALLIGILGGTRAVRRHGIDEDDFLSVIMVAIICAFVGARLYYVVFNWRYYGANPGEIIAIWHGGLAIHGGILGGVLAMWVMCRHYHIAFWELADIAAPFLALGQAIGRWGNFFNQEAYGAMVDKAQVPWAIYIEATGAYHHPTFLYESLWDLLVFILLYGLGRQVFAKQGDVALGYFMLYSVGRFMVEGLRTDSLMLGPLRMAQVMSLILFIGALALMIYRHKKYGEALPPASGLPKKEKE